jgi:hypothetical protein
MASRRTVRRRALRELLLPSVSAGVVGAGIALLVQACALLPPRDPDDLCAIFSQHRSWHEAARSSYRRWGVPEPVILAVLHQESRFRAKAKPGWRRVLGLIPVGRLSTAYGYGQVKEGTWTDYVRSTGRGDAERDEFSDVVDFVGWYGDVIHRATAVAKDDAFHLYLAYHEGPAGFRGRSFDDKPWLLGVARKVQSRAALYASQYGACPEPPDGDGPWPF